MIRGSENLERDTNLPRTGSNYSSCAAPAVVAGDDRSSAGFVLKALAGHGMHSTAVSKFDTAGTG